MGKIVKMSFEGQNFQLIGKWTAVLCFQKEIDSRGCSDQALGAPGVALTKPWGYIHGYYHSNQTSLLVFYLGFQVSVYRTIGPLVSSPEPKAHR